MFFKKTIVVIIKYIKPVIAKMVKYCFGDLLPYIGEFLKMIANQIGLSNLFKLFEVIGTVIYYIYCSF